MNLDDEERIMSTKIINGWDGDPVSEEFLLVAHTAWSEWLDRMEKSIVK
jgi:hypothetical protein